MVTCTLKNLRKTYYENYHNDYDNIFDLLVIANFKFPGNLLKCDIVKNCDCALQKSCPYHKIDTPAL